MSSSGTPKKTGAGYPGQMGLWGSTSDFNKTTFLVKQLLTLVRTASLVKVVKCTNEGGLAATGMVDVLPLVNMVDGLNNVTEHETVYGLTYCRVQGGKNAVICDPEPGDIGVAVFADRDISKVKKTKKQAAPGSRRKNSLADGMYLFSVLSDVPEQYLRFHPDGIELVDKHGNKIEMVEDGIKINGVLFDREQNISNIEEATSKTDVTLTQHTHAQGDDSHGDNEAETDPPTEGT